MAWPRTIYVGTKKLGIYTCEDFVSPLVQPTWTTMNAGLTATTLRWFGMEPSDHTIFYCLLEDGSFWSKVGGADWVQRITAAEEKALCSRADTMDGQFQHCCTDPLTPGTLWAYFYGWDWPGTMQICRSQDYGVTWHHVKDLYTGTFAYGWGCMSARGDHVQVPINHGGYGVTVMGSDDGGVTWWKAPNGSIGGSSWSSSGWVSPHTPTKGYWMRRVDTPAALSTAENAVVTHLTTERVVNFHDQCFWFDPADPLHMLSANGEFEVCETTDDWATVTDHLTPNSYRECGILVPDANQYQQLFQGMYTNSAGLHTIYAVDLATGTRTPIDGTNAGTPPYTDAIPTNCGQICLGGLQCLPFVAGRWYVSNCKFTEVA